jgi:endo-1,4-beta-xylanase
MTNNNKSGRRSFLIGLGACSSILLARQYKSFSAQIQGLDIDKYPDLLAQANINKTLKELAVAKGLIYGAFPQRSYNDFVQEARFQSAFIRECDLVVGGFFGVSVGPQPENTYNFQDTDFWINFASENNMKFRGHPLLWNEFNSSWVVDKFKNPSTTSGEVEQILTNIVTTLVGRYAGKVHSWDVVNEIINPDDGRADGLKDPLKSGIRGEFYPAWLNFLGPDYIDLAFRLAAQTDPTAILCYNDFAIEYNFDWQERRRQAILQNLSNFKTKGIPIHALGIQSHLNAGWNENFDAQKFRQFLKDVASMGYKIIISELDVIDRDLRQKKEFRDRKIAQAYYQYLSVVLDEPAVTTIINWGLSDRYTWISGFAPRADGKPVRPLPLDSNYNYKLAWKAIAKAFEEAPNRGAVD